MRYLTGKEISKVLDNSNDYSSIGLSFRLMFFCGLRVAEVSKINRSDLLYAMSSGMFHVRKQIAKYKRSRSIPVCQPLATSIDHWLNINKRARKLWPYSLRTVQRRITDFSNKLGFAFTAHNLRHSFACAIYDRTKDLSLVQSLLGHSNLKSTLIYVHLDGLLQGIIWDSLKNFTSLPDRKSYICPTSPKV